ncbi:class I SAM-dependent methyltransferase [Streptomyces sp. NBC_00316]|uniref:class I SAM-dependent methyltransferase n=1 Tax=Streptomyces sp. NBC_00316 TaxID=2975710 RepID=UPI002E2A44A3|nr:class I SAM-dependent methyltransferase [Streptomyces sp. NBC_00316]
MSVSPHHQDAAVPREADDLYATPPPWDIGRPQPALLALAEAGAIRGRVLDAGCGTGEHVQMAARLGLDATGIDLAARALRSVEETTRARGLAVRFLRHDARQLADIGEHFDTVLDCGLFHVLDGEDRTAYVDGLRSVVSPGGRCFMLCISDREHGARGPVHKVTRGDAEAAFATAGRSTPSNPPPSNSASTRATSRRGSTH